MTYEDFKQLIMSKSVNRHKLPDDVEMRERVLSALKRVAKDTVVLTLVVNSPIGQQIMRRADSDTYIRYPKKPFNAMDRIETDEGLMDAAALFVIAGLEKANAKVYMGMYYTEIENNDAIQIEAIVSDDYDSSFFRNPSEVFA